MLVVHHCCPFTNERTRWIILPFFHGSEIYSQGNRNAAQTTQKWQSGHAYHPMPVAYIYIFLAPHDVRRVTGGVRPQLPDPCEKDEVNQSDQRSGADFMLGRCKHYVHMKHTHPPGERKTSTSTQRQTPVVHSICTPAIVGRSIKEHVC